MMAEVWGAGTRSLPGTRAVLFSCVSQSHVKVRFSFGCLG